MPNNRDKEGGKKCKIKKDKIFTKKAKKDIDMG